MAKKQKRNVASTKKPTSNLPKSTPAAASTVSRYASPSGEFNPDYTYVKKDLKRIGTLAGSFLVIMVILSFFLR